VQVGVGIVSFQIFKDKIPLFHRFLLETRCFPCCICLN
jgi:hypothetical protein